MLYGLLFYHDQKGRIMTLIISNKDVESIFTMEACINSLEDGYQELAQGRAVNSPQATQTLYPIFTIVEVVKALVEIRPPIS